MFHGSGEESQRFKPAFVVVNRIFDFPGIEQLLRHIFGTAGLFVAPHAEGEAFEQDGARILAHVFGELADCLVHLEDIVSIHLHCFHAVANAFIDELAAAELLA